MVLKTQLHPIQWEPVGLAMAHTVGGRERWGELPEGPSLSLQDWGWGQDAFLSPFGSGWEQGSACLGERKGISLVREGQRWAEYR